MKYLTIGAYSPLTGPCWGGGHVVKQVIELALSQVNNRTDILPGYELRMVLNDTKVCVYCLPDSRYTVETKPLNSYFTDKGAIHVNWRVGTANTEWYPIYPQPLLYRLTVFTFLFSVNPFHKLFIYYFIFSFFGRNKLLKLNGTECFRHTSNFLTIFLHVFMAFRFGSMAAN